MFHCFPYSNSMDRLSMTESLSSRSNPYGAFSVSVRSSDSCICIILASFGLLLWLKCDFVPRISEREWFWSSQKELTYGKFITPEWAESASSVLLCASDEYSCMSLQRSSLSMSCISNIQNNRIRENPFRVTVPSFAQRGSGLDSHYEFEVKVPLSIHFT